MPQDTPMEIPPEILKILASKMGSLGGAMTSPGMPLPGGVPGTPRPQPQQSASSAYNVRNDPKASVGSLTAPTPPQPPASYQGSGPVGVLISLLGNWHSSKQKGEQAEASRAAQDLMQAIEGGKTTGDWTPAYTILHNNEKLFNKVYKGWLQKSELQQKEKQKTSKAPEADVQGFEHGVQSYLQSKNSQQPSGAPPAGSAPRSMGGYQIPAASPQQALEQQHLSAERQATSQDPGRSLGDKQLTSGETRQAELSKSGLASTPAAEAKIAGYAAAVQKAMAEAKKAELELQIKTVESQSAESKGKVGLDIEKTKHQKALVDLDISRQKLRLEILKTQTGGKLKTAPAGLRTRFIAAEQAESYVNSVLKTRGDNGFTKQDVQDLQGMLREAGSTSLAGSLPGWFGQNMPNWLGGTGRKDVESLLDSIRDYKTGLERTLDEGFPGWKTGGKVETKPEAQPDNDDSGDDDDPLNILPPKPE